MPDERLDQHAGADHLGDQVEGRHGQRAERGRRARRLLLQPERQHVGDRVLARCCASARRAGTARSGTPPGSRRSTGSRRTRTGRSARRCRGTTRPTCSRRRSQSRSAAPVMPRPAAQKSVGRVHALRGEVGDHQRDARPPRRRERGLVESAAKRVMSDLPVSRWPALPLRPPSAAAALASGSNSRSALLARTSQDPDHDELAEREHVAHGQASPELPPMKSGAYPARMMKPKYQARKKIVPGTTNRLRLRTSLWNSGDRSAATQSIVRRAPHPHRRAAQSSESPPRRTHDRFRPGLERPYPTGRGRKRPVQPPRKNAIRPKMNA